MKTSELCLLLLFIGSALTACASPPQPALDARAICRPYIDRAEAWELSARRNNDELLTCRTQSYLREDLPATARDNCFLIITNGTKPEYPDMEVHDLHTLNVTSDQVTDRVAAWFDHKPWPYWLACENN